VTELFQRAALIIQCSVRGFSSSTIELSRRGLSCSTLCAHNSAQRPFELGDESSCGSNTLSPFRDTGDLLIATSTRLSELQSWCFSGLLEAMALEATVRPPRTQETVARKYRSCQYQVFKLHRFAFKPCSRNYCPDRSKMANLWFAAVCLQRYWRGSLIALTSSPFALRPYYCKAIARGSSARLRKLLCLEAGAAGAPSRHTGGTHLH
jgi:hypothetical protein